MMNEKPLNNTENREDCQPAVEFSPGRELINNVPYIAMTLLGTAILFVALANPVLRWPAAGAYLVYGAAGALWIMIFVCPYCRFYNTRACPCGYGRIAVHLRERQDYDRFNEKFKKHIPVIVPLWFIPVLTGIPIVITSFSWSLLVLLVVFAVDAFAVLPLLSTKHGCAECPQKETCPWMAGKATA
jgi:hypothetical protein